MCKSAQNNSSNGGLDAAIKGILHVGLNVALEGAPWVHLKEPSKMYKKMTKTISFKLDLKVHLRVNLSV